MLTNAVLSPRMNVIFFFFSETGILKNKPTSSLKAIYHIVYDSGMVFYNVLIWTEDFLQCVQAFVSFGSNAQHSTALWNFVL